MRELRTYAPTMKMEKRMAIATENYHFLPVRDKKGLSIHPPLCTCVCMCVCVHACMLNNSVSLNFYVLLQEKTKHVRNQHCCIVTRGGWKLTSGVLLNHSPFC